MQKISVMSDTIFQKWLRNMGKNGCVNRLEVMIANLELAKRATDARTASVVEDVIDLLEKAKRDYEEERVTVPPAVRR